MPAIIKEDIDRLYQLGIYLPTRTIYLGGIVEDDSVDEAWNDTAEEPGIYWNIARRIIMGIHVLDSNAQNGRKPITIIMNSCGGDYSHGMAIFDAIKHAKNHITIINMSHARSMTSLIFQAGDLRITAPSGHYMIHDGEMTESGTPKTVKNWIEYEHNVCLPKMYQIYLDRIQETDDDDGYKVDIRVAAEIINVKLPKGATKININRGIKGIRIAHIQQLCAQDTIFTPEEMVRLNFADRLLDTNDLVGAYANPKMHALPTGFESMQDEDENK